ncbi:hypothetical protein AAZX31_07G092800 [Glycine max]|uniref:Uncharacterized protein n=1 Tax=Glycine max TaxID=3847 RepID=K7L0P8_SOYBN|nr:uncharacterized protein LOC102668299 [Glycine max]KAH1086159.1 hypothetical protein GYH30_017907 [Glycine max]KRH48564.1 hypothetical protein GLYMA_07G097400v4 [Glycine max]|eukprot:XP_006583437.1 uncharacterized protein LOC102668299 [Glycine max]
MNANLLRNLSFHARRLRFSPTPTVTAPTCFSSRSHAPDKPHSLVEDISDEELKRRVAKLQEGDAEAIPSVFEAILQRYLAGKPIEADQELMRGILGKWTLSEDEEDESDSHWEEIDDTDNEDGV